MLLVEEGIFWLADVPRTRKKNELYNIVAKFSSKEYVLKMFLILDNKFTFW